MQRTRQMRTQVGTPAKSGKTLDLAGLFSKSESVRRVERDFLVRFAHYLRRLTVADLHLLVVSGRFNEIFPAVEDETAAVPPRRFEDVKPFDYESWARRAKVSV